LFGSIPGAFAFAAFNKDTATAIRRANPKSHIGWHKADYLAQEIHFLTA
jgi:hypothetical protein